MQDSGSGQLREQGPIQEAEQFANPSAFGPYDPAAVSMFARYQSSATVENALSKPLPRSWNDVGDWALGGAGQPTPDALFGASTKVSTMGLYAFPPASTADFTKVTFLVGQLDLSRVWYLNFVVGIHKINGDESPLNLKIVVSGAPVLASEKPWDVIFSRDVVPGTTTQLSLPLGLWAMREDLKIAVQVQKVTPTQGVSLLVLDHLKLDRGQRRPEQGIVRSGLVWFPEAERVAVIDGIKAMRAQWFRDGTAPGSESVFVENVRLAKEKGLKVLFLVTQFAVDYDALDPRLYLDDEGYRNYCSAVYGALPLAQVNHAKLRTRLRNQLALVKSAGLSIDAFEIGNEMDWICFNGDIRPGRIVGDDNLRRLARSYALFLQAVATVVKEFFPTAILITGGMADIPDYYAPMYHLSDPGRLLPLLANIDGFNYLENPVYRIDGFALHIYPDVNSAREVGGANLRRFARHVQHLGKTIWVTEWGFASSPSVSGDLRLRAMTEFLDMLNSQFIAIGPQFFYAYNSPFEKNDDGSFRFSLVDVKSQWLPEASLFSARYALPH